MKTPHAILIGFCLVALAFFVGSYQTAQSQARGPFNISAANQNTTWIVNQATGQVAYCLRDNSSLDPTFIKKRPPFCSGWSN